MNNAKKLFLGVLAFGLIPTVMVGCGQDDYGPDEPSQELIEPVNVIDKYVKDTTDYSKLVMQPTTKVRIHYRRNDDSDNNRLVYKPWNIWAWDITNGGNGAVYDFTTYDKYGVFVDVPLETVGSGKTVKEMGFIVRTDNWSKDPDGDRSLEIPEESLGGFAEIFCLTQDPTIFEKAEDALKSTMTCSYMISNKEIGVVFKPLRKEFKPYPKRFSIQINGEPFTNFSMGEYDVQGHLVSLKLNQEIKLTDTVDVFYKFDPSWNQKQTMLITSYYDTDEFTNAYTYTGDDLGVTFDNEENPTKTTFKVWAPTSKKITLKVYYSGTYDTDVVPVIKQDMTLGEKGVWSTTVDRDLDGFYYTYEVTNMKGTNEVTDPYAKSAGVNGKRGMIVNFTKLNKEINWSDKDKSKFDGNNVDAIIYEAHVRDMTINPNSGVTAANRGKFLGLTEDSSYTEGGETVSTGLNHIKELEITHVQLQPIYDFNSVDESSPNPDMSLTNYNWGYDPQNYNVLEGSYSSDPYDGLSRIKEFKKLVQTFHDNGLSINMDVVYNHTGSTEGSNLQLLAPFYYYRTYTKGTFYNGSGCGNELASERSMVNKFVRDSVKFWVKEYFIDGFRFDLMGLVDNQTMIDVYKDCSALNPHIMVYGEPWTGGTSKLKQGNFDNRLKEQQTIQSSLAQDYFAGSNVLVGAFNDVIRNAIRGDNGPGTGFVQGLTSQASVVLQGCKGIFSSSTVKEGRINPNQVLNYVSCHDNYTLNDQLAQTNKKGNKAAYTQADAMIMFGEGVPFIQEGEEFMRSKTRPDGTYEGNSYNVGDFINNMDYSLKIKNADVFYKTAEMISLRKDVSLFRLSNREDINNKMKSISLGNQTCSYELSDGEDTYYIIHSAINNPEFSLPKACDVIFDNVTRVANTNLTSISLGVNESVVLKVSK